MNINVIIKKQFAYPMSFLKFLRKYGNINNKNEFLILLYHRIIEKNSINSYVQDGMYVKPETFDKHVQYLKRNFDIISLESLFQKNDFLINRKSNLPFCILTFDDGWKDFYENAYPILIKHEAFATVFLPTDLIGTKRRLWTDQLADLIMDRNNDMIKNIILSDSNEDFLKSLCNLKGSHENRVEKSIALLKTLPVEKIENTINILSKLWKVDLKEKDRCFLTWEEVRKMYASGLIQFGSHSKRHNILTTVADRVVWEELVESRTRLLAEEVATQSFLPFSYPNGNFTYEIARMVEEAGYSIALTTIKGWNRISNNRSDNYQLKRIGIHENIASTKHMLACRLHGIY